MPMVRLQLITNLYVPRIFVLLTVAGVRRTAGSQRSPCSLRSRKKRLSLARAANIMASRLEDCRELCRCSAANAIDRFPTKS